jgi:ribosomal-protein-alanine N-acetyltransferase
MKFNFTPFPTLETRRLNLKQATRDDLDEVLFLRSDSEVNKYIKRAPNMTMADAEKFIENTTKWISEGESIYWSMALHGDPKMIGSICLWNFSEDCKTGEVGYGIHTDFQGMGLMTEALERILDYGFEALDLDQIEAYTDRRNEASLKLLQKKGFTLLEHRKDEDNDNNLILVVKNPARA